MRFRCFVFFRGTTAGPVAKSRRFDRGNEGHFGLASAPMTMGLPPEFKSSAVGGGNLEKRQYMPRTPLNGANGTNARGRRFAIRARRSGKTPRRSLESRRSICKDAIMKITEVMGRRAFIARAVAFVGSGVFLLSRDVGAEEALDPATLKSQLCVKTKLEEAFVDDVLDKVDEGLLPRKILIAAYRYALKKGRSQRLIFFKSCLETLAKRAGIKIEFKSF